MTDNCPKLFKIDVYAFRENDYLKVKPIRLLIFGFGFSGSTLIGTNVKIESLIDQYVYDPSLLRNKIAHGQWKVR